MPVQYVSEERLKVLNLELHELKTVKRREVAERLELAKALGDLSENAEYHEAKDEMIAMETRIFELEEFLKDVRVIDERSGSDGIVRVGSRVVVVVNGKNRSFQIVGSNEADPLSGKISNESPIGSGLLGAQVGQQVSVTTPTGVTVFKVKQVD